MEKLIINVPEEKSILVKQLLKELGVTIQEENVFDGASYKQKLLDVSVWNEEDVKFFEESKNALESLKPQQW
ncbi:hypothetical protein [Mucilaginibacter arboris]|uniref:Uncharacterized protein n=1 Tax=Mucilaginibacter arboris TaxID=2682090 RepID=A0A7K1T150_9SPHI|nr:hypothetical protein [Mucilaginibacter arboris]MVN23285.1 hypothetical protein [Mucilaginibacter arboris]